MSFRPEEVSAVIQKELAKFSSKLEMESRGSILQVGDGIARIWGLEDSMAGELLEFPGGVMGMVLNLEEGMVGQLEVFEIERTLLDAEQEMLANHWQVLNDTVSLYKALGGGWPEDIVSSAAH